MWKHDGFGTSAIWIAESEPDSPNAGLSTLELLERTRRGQLVSRSGKAWVSDNDLRADSANSLVDDFGLMRRIHRDDADRKITEYELAPGHTKIGGWMRPYTAQAQRCMYWNKDRKSDMEAKAIVQQKLADEKQLAEQGAKSFHFSLGV